MPVCDQCGGFIRPDVVWFGESIDQNLLNKAFISSENSGIFIVVGTSGLVYPAAHLPIIARNNGAIIIEVNLEETPITPIADISLREKASDGLYKLFRPIIKKGGV